VAIRLRKTTHAVGGILGPLLAGAALGRQAATPRSRRVVA
jgi:hypothetical protein